MPDINILVVDDEKEIADLIEIYLVSVDIKYLKQKMQRWDLASWTSRISIWCC